MKSPSQPPFLEVQIQVSPAAALYTHRSSDWTLSLSLLLLCLPAWLYASSQDRLLFKLLNHRLRIIGIPSTSHHQTLPENVTPRQLRETENEGAGSTPVAETAICRMRSSESSRWIKQHKQDDGVLPINSSDIGCPLPALIVYSFLIPT